MTPEQLETIHAAAFSQIRPWSRSEFATLLDSPHCFLISMTESFALGRVLGPEVELLTLAVHPVNQGKGHGRLCLERYEATARRKGAEESFLEVSADNNIAIILYKSVYYKEVSRRTGYYRNRDGSRSDALFLRKSLKI